MAQACHPQVRAASTTRGCPYSPKTPATRRLGHPDPRVVLSQCHAFGFEGRFDLGDGITVVFARGFEPGDLLPAQLAGPFADAVRAEGQVRSQEVLRSFAHSSAI